MPIDYANVSYGLLKAGDTLKVVGKPHYDAQGAVAVERGAEVMVDEVHPAGVTVKTKDGKKVAFYFDHGADKLQYTTETKAALAKRAEFGAADEK